MQTFAVDEDFNHNMLRAVYRRLPNIDMRTVQDEGLSGEADPNVLAWAAGEGRVLLTHDVSTMTSHFNQRLEQKLPMPGVIRVPQTLSLAKAIDDIGLLAECADDRDLADRIIHLPLR